MHFYVFMFLYFYVSMFLFCVPRVQFIKYIPTTGINFSSRNTEKRFATGLYLLYLGNWICRSPDP